jgi:protein-S-isoprenylcysteine O-methyltransferase Ste14
MMEDKPKVGRYKKWERKRRDVVFTALAGLLFIGQVVMCIIAYNSYGVSGLTIVGWILIAIAIIVGGLSWYAVRRQKLTEDREWLTDTVLVDIGIYEVIRHPVYFSFMLYVVSLMLISHWITIILGVPVVAYLYWAMKQEEWASVDKFGEEYVDYMEKVPRLNIVAGLINYYRKRKEQQH